MQRSQVKRKLSRRHVTGNDGKAYMLVEVMLIEAASFTVDGPPAGDAETRFELADGSIVDEAADGLFVVRATGVVLRPRR